MGKKKKPDAVDDIIAIIASAAIMVALLYFAVAAVFAIPVALVCWGGWLAYKWQTNNPTALEKKAKVHTRELYLAAKEQFGEPLSKEEFGQLVYRKTDHNLPDELADNLIEAALDLYDWEELEEGLPSPPAVCNSLEGARYRDYLSAQSAKTNQGVMAKVAVSAIVESFANFLSYIPGVKRADDAVFTYRLRDNLAGDLNAMVGGLMQPYFLEEPVQFGLFKRLREIMIRNVHEISNIEYTPQNFDHPDLIYPNDYVGDNVVLDYLKNTPFLDIFNAHIPVEIPEKTRFEHTWCIAPPGTGKTQLIQYLVSRDLPKVVNGEASIVVMDSAGDLIDQISSLDIFGLGSPLFEKLIVIKPDLEYPPALNLFDMGRDRISAYNENDREKLTNTVIDQLTYVIDAMMGETAALTSKQETLYRYIIRLLMTLPKPSLDVFGDLLTMDKPSLLQPYQKYVNKLPKPAQDFFNDQFFGKEFKATKDQVSWRLARLRENTFFDRMFSHSKSKLDLFTELNESKVILIHTDVDNLKAEGTNVLGRYFIGALLAASQERASLSHSKRLPVFAYIDECQDYIANDTKIATLLDQARKMNIGMFLAHQRTAQIKDRNVLDALANTAIKFASTDNPNDLTLVSKAMRADPNFIATQPKGHFAVSARRVVDAFSFKVPFFVMENMEKMTPEIQAITDDHIREKYYSKFLSSEEPVLRAVAEDEAEYVSGEDIDVSPSDDWDS